MLASRGTTLTPRTILPRTRTRTISSTAPRTTVSSGWSSLSSHVKTVGVVGTGQMGLGIAYVAAKTAKANVLLMDKNETQLEKGFAFIDKLLDKDAKKDKLGGQDPKDVRRRLEAVGGIPDLKDVDLVIEAVSENLQLKESIFSSLASHLRPEAILSSNTSSISLSKIAAAAVPAPDSPQFSHISAHDSAARVVGFHFFNPVPVMPLVELIPALQTSPSTLSTARSFAEEMGKTVTQSLDSPGFVSNRLLMPFINEAILVLESGVASKEDIDETLKLGMGHPMGPLQLADFIGLDTCLAIQETLLRETGDTKYRPSVLLGRMVSAGWLGKKSGKGFYEYK